MDRSEPGAGKNDRQIRIKLPMEREQTPKERGDGRFVHRLLITGAIGVFAYVVWLLSSLLPLLFGSLLIAVLLRAAAYPLIRLARVPEKPAVLLSAVLVLALVGVVVWLFDDQIETQFAELVHRLPKAWKTLEAQFSDLPSVRRALQNVYATASGGAVVKYVAKFAGSAAFVLADTVLVIFAGIYFALQPKLYRDGALQLLPIGWQRRAGESLDATANALRLWLLGQLFAMVGVGVLTWAGLWLLGIPSSAGLGVFAGLAEFVPYVGPIVSSIPGLLIAMNLGWPAVFWTFCVYLLVHQIEGNAIIPLVERQTVALPPAITLFSVIAFTLLFGPLGLLMATPLTVAVFVAIKKLWVREALHERTEIPGE